MFKVKIQGNYKIGSQELLYCHTPVPKTPWDEADEVIVEKVKVWYLEYYEDVIYETETRKDKLTNRIFMSHKYKREEAIKYLKLIYDTRVFYIKRIFNRELYGSDHSWDEIKELFKLSKDKRAVLLDKLKFERDYHDSVSLKRKYRTVYEVCRDYKCRFDDITLI